jgi:hypothetical protein
MQYFAPGCYQNEYGISDIFLLRKAEDIFSGLRRVVLRCVIFSQFSELLFISSTPF